MDPNEAILAAIKRRQRKQTEFGYGIITADRYVSSLQDCVGSDVCYRYASKGQTSFNDVLRKAAKTLVYSNAAMVVEEIKGAAELQELQGKFTFPKNTLMAFKHVLTTPMQDRDGDIMRTEGAEPDPRMLLLWQHVHTLPIGKMVGTVEHTKDHLKLVSAIVDVNELCHDAAVMIDNDMGRFSHGFRALEFEELKDDKGVELGGFDVKRFEIMEESLVSVPSNTDAQTEEVILSLVEGGKLTSPLLKQYGKSIREHRPKSAQVGIDLKLTLNGEEIHDGILDGSGKTEGGGEGGARGSSKQTNDSAAEPGEEEGTADSKDAEGAGARSAEGKVTTYQCECLECGHKAEFDEHCRDIECPECGGAMRRAERLGPGASTQSAEEKEVKSIGASDLEGSWEEITDNLRASAKAFLSSKISGMKENDWVWITATFPNFAVLCWESSEPYGGRQYFKVSWIGGENGPEFAGEPKEVKFSVEIEEVVKQARLEQTKQGRVLSKGNEAKIRDALEAVNEVLGMDIPRPAKATLREASSGLGQVLKVLDADEEPKQAELSLKDAMSMVIFQTTMQQRSTLLKTLEVIERNEKQKETAEEVRSMLGA